MKIAILPGDGVGPEVTKAAVRVLKEVGEMFGISVDTGAYVIGGEAIRSAGSPFPYETATGCLESDAVLLGAAGDEAFNTMRYSTAEVDRVARVAFDAARARRGKMTSVDKANVLETSQLWRATVEEVAKEYPEIEVEHMFVDACAMHLVTNPRRFDVILTENLFGDILSDEAAVLTGSLGMLGSATIGGSVDLYEPVHGSAADIAGKNIANLFGAISSV